MQQHTCTRSKRARRRLGQEDGWVLRPQASSKEMDTVGRTLQVEAVRCEQSEPADNKGTKWRYSPK